MNTPHTHRFARLLLVFGLLLSLASGGLPAQNPGAEARLGCGDLVFSLQQTTPACCFRLRATNANPDHCFQQIHLTLNGAAFSSFIPGAGWQWNQSAPNEITIRPSVGFVPLGQSTPGTFCVTGLPTANLSLTWDDLCLMEGCAADFTVNTCPTNNVIKGRKYVDIGCRGEQYLGQPTLTDWEITLSDEFGNVLGTDLTDATGEYAFYQLPYGQYLVKEAVRPGWTANVPASGQAAVTLSTQNDTQIQNFGNCPTTCSCDSVYVNLNQELGTSDTSVYYLSVSNRGQYCFSYVNIEVGSGQLLDWSVLATGWQAALVAPGLLQLTPPILLLPAGGTVPLKIRVRGAGDHNLATVTTWSDGQGEVTCRRPFTFLSPPVARQSCCPTGKIAGPERVVNGNFSGGYASFSSDYQYKVPGSAVTKGRFSVVQASQVFAANPQWVGNDNTTGAPTGKFLIADAPVASNRAAWRQTITSLPASTEHYFCAYANNLVRKDKNFNDPVLELWIVGTGAPNAPIATVSLPENPDVWVKFSGSWTTPASPAASYVLEIRSTASTGAGHDFGLDDISFRACSAPPCAVSIQTTLLDHCGHVQLQAIGTGTQPIGYQWCNGSISPMQDLYLPCGPFTCAVTATCANGTTATATASLNISDNVPPTAICAPGFGVTLGPNCTYNLSASDIDGGSTDNCPGLSMSVSPAVLTGCGVTTVTLTVKDWCGNTATCTTGVQTIEVDPPKVHCPPDITILCDKQLTPMFTGVATATDNCPGNISISYSDNSIGLMPCNAIVTRIWTAKDDCGNTGTCAQTITVRDIVPPTVNCPQNTTVNTLPGVCYYQGNLPPGLSGWDNCRPVTDFVCSLLTPTQSILINAATQFPKGVNTITCYAIDFCGNTSLQNCQYTLTVEDHEPPKITCPLSLTVVGALDAAGRCKAIVGGLAPTISDNCPMLNLGYTISGATTATGTGDASGTMFMAGVSTVTYTVTDMAGQTATCDFTVTVRCPPACPPGCVTTSLNLSTGFDPASGTFGAPGGTDPMWTLVDAPNYLGLQTPQPAHLIGPYGAAWDAPQSTWMSAYSTNSFTGNNCATGGQTCQCDPFVFERCFCLCEPDTVHFNFGFWSDNAGAVELWNNSGPMLTLADNCANANSVGNFNAPPSGSAFNAPPTVVNQSVFLPAGRYCLRIKNWNISSVAMGVNLLGTVSGLRLEADSCCEKRPNGLCVSKYNDLDCDGERDINQQTWQAIDPPLSGWNFTAVHTSTGQQFAGTTTAQGEICFLNIPAGNYFVSETQQPGWVPSNPAGGTTVATVGQTGITNVAFGNCDSCACGPFELLYGVGHGPVLPKKCGDTLYVPSNLNQLPLQFYASFHCNGSACPPQTWVNYTLTTPTGSHHGGLWATPNLALPISNATFTTPGTYTLTLLGHCGTKICPCRLTFIYPSDCCKDYEIFCQNAENAIAVTTDDDSCKATINIGSLPACDSIEWVNWGDSQIDYGPFTAGDMLMHQYAGSGTYVISMLVVEWDYSVVPPRICFEKILTDTITVCDTCDCGGLEWADFFHDWNLIASPKCGDVVPVPCPRGKDFFIHGNLLCKPDACGTGTVTWTLVRPGTLAPVSGSLSGIYPHFDLSLPASLFPQPGAYALTIERNCGTKRCTCTIYLQVPPCECLCEDLQKDVAQGFTVSGGPLTCKRTFTPVALCPDDVVSWLVPGLGTFGPTTGNTPQMITFPGPGIYTVCMAVSRIEPTTCEVCIFKICRKIKVKCNAGGPDPTLSPCPVNGFANGDFTLGATDGEMGRGGAATNWSLFPNLGDGFAIVDADAGASEAGHIILHGDQNDFAGIWQKLSNPQPAPLTLIECDFRNYLGAATPVGTELEFRLQAEPVLGSPSKVLYVLPIGPDDAGWQSRSLTIPKSLDATKPYLVICLRNADGSRKSVVGIDGLEICTATPFTSAADEPGGLGSVRIFPNPNTGLFTVETAAPVAPGTLLRVLDLAGRLLLEKPADAGSTRQTVQADGLPQGLYLLQIVSNGRAISVEKFVVQ